MTAPTWHPDWDAFAAWAEALAKEHASRTPEEGVRRSLDAFEAWGVPVPVGLSESCPGATAPGTEGAS